MNAPIIHTAADVDQLLADGLCDVSVAAEFLGLGRSSIYALLQSGELPMVKIGRSTRIPRRSLVELAARHLRGGPGRE